MSQTLLVGNLDSRTDVADLLDVFAQFGDVSGVLVACGQETGDPLGFAFVEMENGSECAIQALHGKEFHGRLLAVKDSGRTFLEAQKEWGSKYEP